jgi:hypothetical protein
MAIFLAIRPIGAPQTTRVIPLPPGGKRTREALLKHLRPGEQSFVIGGGA